MNTFFNLIEMVKVFSQTKFFFISASCTVCDTPYVNDYRFWYCEWEDYIFWQGIILDSSCLFFIIISKTNFVWYYINSVAPKSRNVITTTNKQNVFSVWHIFMGYTTLHENLVEGFLSNNQNFNNVIVCKKR